MTFSDNDPLHLPPRYGKIQDCTNRPRSPASTFNELLLGIKDIRLHESDEVLNGQDRLVPFYFQSSTPFCTNNARA